MWWNQHGLVLTSLLASSALRRLAGRRGPCSGPATAQFRSCTNPRLTANTWWWFLNSVWSPPHSCFSCLRTASSNSLAASDIPSRPPKFHRVWFPREASQVSLASSFPPVAATSRPSPSIPNFFCLAASSWLPGFHTTSSTSLIRMTSSQLFSQVLLVVLGVWGRHEEPSHSVFL